MSGLSSDRRRAMLRTAMGPGIAAALADPRVIEIMVNPDGALRLDVLGEGRVETGIVIPPQEVERIIRLVASHARAEIHNDAPIISSELPPHAEGRAGERFEGILPPVAIGPCFSIRKPAERLYRLIDYVTDGLMSPDAARILSLAVIDRRNILVIAEAIDLIVFISGRGLQRRIASIVRLTGVDPEGGGYGLVDILPADLTQGGIA